MMMKRILIAALVGFTAAFAFDGFAASTADDAIKQVFGQIDRCLENNDAKCVGDLLVEDATFIAPNGGGKIVKGKAEIVKTFQELFANSPKGLKRKQSIKNVRMIGEDHALVDASVDIEGMKPNEANAPGESYHAVALMILKSDQWLLRDLRSYAVEVPAAKK